MARREEPPQFPNPVEIIPPSTNLLFSDKLYLQDSILYSCYRCINPGKQGRSERERDGHKLIRQTNRQKDILLYIIKPRNKSFCLLRLKDSTLKRLYKRDEVNKRSVRLILF